MAHFKLKTGVYFVQGVLRGAVLDTNTENVYSVNASAVSIITGEVQNESYWQQLVNMNLAESCNQTDGFPSLPRNNQPIPLKFIWFEVTTSDCNACCIHCYADSMPPSYRRNLGLPIVDTNESKPKLTYDTWCALIAEGYKLGARKCQLIGGEPLVYHDNGRDVLDLAEFAKKVGHKSVEIFTNATLLSRRKVQRIKELGLKMAVSLYSNEAAVHDAITQVPGSHTKTMAALYMLREFEIETRVEVVGMQQNEATLPQTIELIRDLGFRTKGADPLRPKGRGDDPALAPSRRIQIQYGVSTRPNFKASQGTVAHYTSGHSCLAGKITITDTGDVLPCVFSRSQIVGNVADVGSLEPIVIGQLLQQCWQATKDDVLVCCDCEYRYVCFDCRPLAEGHAQGRADYLNAPYPRCSYNPYSGEWGQGLWRMNEDGPFYDRSFGLAIQQVIAEVGIVMNTPISH